MPEYLLLEHYRGGPRPRRPVPPIDQWAPEDVEAHISLARRRLPRAAALRRRAPESSTEALLAGAERHPPTAPVEVVLRPPRSCTAARGASPPRHSRGPGARDVPLRFRHVGTAR